VQRIADTGLKKCTMHAFCIRTRQIKDLAIAYMLRRETT